VIQQNRIVASLPDAHRLRIVRHMEPVDLSVRDVLLQSGDDNDRVYFPTVGLASVVLNLSDGVGVECAAIGAEGWVGAYVFRDLLPAGLVAFQQIAGAALRMSRKVFEQCLADEPQFAARVHRFAAVMLSNAMQTTLCNRLHDATARCARWLLFTRERVGSDELAITQDFLGQMLGSSRSAVTATMSQLESKGFVHRARGSVVICDAEGLRSAACECHDTMQETHRRYLSTLAAR
jgi:CRP-like cAMP-binding protein